MQASNTGTSFIKPYASYYGDREIGRYSQKNTLVTLITSVTDLNTVSIEKFGKHGTQKISSNIGNHVLIIKYHSGFSDLKQNEGAIVYYPFTDEGQTALFKDPVRTAL